MPGWDIRRWMGREVEVEYLDGKTTAGALVDYDRDNGWLVLRHERLGETVLFTNSLRTVRLASGPELPLSESGDDGGP
jgi:hypothetical protein